MKGRPWLLLLLVASIATLSYSKTLTPLDDIAETNNVLSDHEQILKDSKIPMAADPRYVIFHSLTIITNILTIKIA